MANRFWVGGNASPNWTAGTTGVDTNWGTASNTRDFAAVPTTSDDVFFDGVGFGNSASTISAAITIKSLTMTGYANTLTHNTNSTLTISTGNFTLASGMTYAINSGSIITINSTSCLFTSAGKTIQNLIISATNASVTLQDALLATGTLSLGANSATGCTFNANNFNVTFASVTANFSLGSASQTITMGSGTWTITSNSNNIWRLSSGSPGTTVNANTSTLVFTDTSGSAKTFTGRGKTYYNITFSGDNFTIADANTYNLLSVNNAGMSNGLLLVISNTQTVFGIRTNGTPGNLAKLTSTSGGTAATLTNSDSVMQSVNYMSIKDITVTAGPGWYAGENSTNVSGNTGWIFHSPNNFM